ncbi:ATP-binding protein [Streptomyces lichenis]|uniref:ATP-binding protein n=1 Tax=Streptomyces lichenis TaxID=2306967 RepID=A0ABT0IIZ3_9ACTN|nr:ATP-binding protein [Streptomyces lichenis]MCK8681296.1 ATP-binding protein [Streptomyces lichenis]
MTMTVTPRPTGHPGYSETLPCDPRSASAARRLVRVALAVWGLPELAGDAGLVVTELVANAARHARGRPVRVAVERPAANRVRVSVADGSKVPPEPRQPRADDERGRGLVLVNALAAGWGTEPLATGKRVWAELDGGRRG